MTDEEREADPAGETGRLAGRAVNALGLRLLRFRAVRRAIQRTAAEAAPAPEPAETRRPPGEEVQMVDSELPTDRRQSESII